MRRRHGGTGLHSLSTCGNDATARCRGLFPRCASCGNAGSVQTVALRLKINQVNEWVYRSLAALNDSDEKAAEQLAESPAIKAELL